jgi:hypothetical protein
MPAIKTSVSLDRKEIEDALVELARKSLDKSVGGVSLEWKFTDDNKSIIGVVVSFTGKIKT